MTDTPSIANIGARIHSIEKMLDKLSEQRDGEHLYIIAEALRKITAELDDLEQAEIEAAQGCALMARRRKDGAHFWVDSLFYIWLHLNCKFEVGMAKLKKTTLKHLSTVIAKMNGGDESRCHSLILVARKERLFTVGGRGLNAAEMEPADYGAALLLGASLAAPGLATRQVKMLQTARLVDWQVEVKDGCVPDGWVSDRTDQYGSPVLPRFLPDEPDDLAGFLEELFASVSMGEWSFHEEDQFRVSEDDKAFTIFALFDGSRHKEVRQSVWGGMSDSDPTPNHFAWEFMFEVRKPVSVDPCFGYIDRIIHSDVLFALQDLARGRIEMESDHV